MKKIILCVVMLSPLIILAQHPKDDANWKIVLNEEFDGTRSWNNNRIDNTGALRAYFHECGVTHGDEERQIYTKKNARFKNGNMVLTAEYAPGTNNYWDVDGINNVKTYNYKSGAIEFTKTFKYGYYEIRCKLPKPSFGNFPAFWLYSEINRYNEIDVFEQRITTDEKQRIFGTYWEKKNGLKGYQQYSEKREVTDTYYSASFHTFAVKWSPGVVVWYIDGVQKGISDNSELVPKDPMWLKANYAIDTYSKIENKNFPMEMVIDYIRVYQLKCEHNKSVTLTTNSQLRNYSPSVKKNIIVKGTQSKVEKNLHLMATDGVEIKGDFEVPLGVEFCAETVGCTCP